MEDKKPIISIIGGKGSMGKLFASFFREHDVKVLISDKQTKISNKEVAEKGDIVIVAVSMGYAEKVIKEITPHIRKDALLADITSVKERPIKGMKRSKSEVLGMHPMFGASNPIPGQMILICPTRSGKWTKWLLNFFKNRGVKLIELTPKQHDKLMTHAQGVIHFADIVFAHTLYKLKKPVKEILDITSPASDIKILLAARLMAQDPHLYGNIQIMNPQNPKVLKQYIKSSEELLKIVKSKDINEFTKYFNSAKKFLGKYADNAYKESTWIIDEVLAHRRKKKSLNKKEKVTKNSLGVLGPKGTFSSLAANKYDSKIKKSYFASIEDAVNAVEQGKVKEGIIPVENKLHGTVRESLDELFYKKVHIEDEIDLEIHHCLITLPHTKLENVKEIISHSQAINQCKKYLKKDFPNAELQAHSSTAAAIEKLIISQNTSLAVIAPEQAAKTNNLKIHKKDIEDQKNNSTKFLIIKKGEQKISSKVNKPKKNKTSIAFYFDADSPGSLFTVFKDFADAKINMTKIESRPTTAKFGDYIFYLDFDGHISNKKVSSTLKKVEKKVRKLKILGSY